jgi:hypothetical protein
MGFIGYLEKNIQLTRLFRKLRICLGKADFPSNFKVTKGRKRNLFSPVQQRKDECYSQRPVPAFAARCLCLRIPVYQDRTGSVHVACGGEGEVMGGAAWWWYPAHSGQTLLEIR